ncbi:MAG: ABC transporter permease subunit [Lentisphaeraceae bacterium]|nr:ABC transporter permease subunit [Lentisphaeraceae bacterium]
MKLSRAFIRETALIQRGITRIFKSPLNIAFFSIIILASFYAIHSISSTRVDAKGNLLFSAMAMINIVAITFYGIGVFSKVVSEETQDKTMQLLRLTPLSHRSLLFGKVLPPLLNIFLLIILQLPLLTLCVTLGGVELVQIIKVYYVIILYTFCLSSIGLYTSIISDENWLAAFNFVFMLFFIFLLSGVVSMFEKLETVYEKLNYLRLSNHFTQIQAIIQDNPTSLIYTTLISISICLIFYKLSLKSFKQYDDDILVANNKTKGPKRTFRFKDMPLLQKESRFHFGGKISQAIYVGALSFIFILGYAAVLNLRFDRHEIAFSNIFPLSLALCFLSNYYLLGNTIRNEINSQNWSALKLTPFTEEKVILSKILAVIKHLSPLYLILTCYFALNLPDSYHQVSYWLKLYPLFYLSPGIIALFFSTTLLTQLIRTKYIGHTVNLAYITLLIFPFTNKTVDFSTWFIVLVNILLFLISFVIYKMMIKKLKFLF